MNIFQILKDKFKLRNFIEYHLSDFFYRGFWWFWLSRVVLVFSYFMRPLIIKLFLEYWKQNLNQSNILNVISKRLLSLRDILDAFPYFQFSFFSQNKRWREISFVDQKIQKDFIPYHISFLSYRIWKILFFSIFFGILKNPKEFYFIFLK